MKLKKNLTILSAVIFLGLVACTKQDENKPVVPPTPDQGQTDTNTADNSAKSDANGSSVGSGEVASKKIKPVTRAYSGIMGDKLQELLDKSGEDGFLIESITFNGLAGYSVILRKFENEKKYSYRTTLQKFGFAVDAMNIVDEIVKMGNDGYMTDQIVSLSIYGLMAISHKEIGKETKIEEGEHKFILSDEYSLYGELKKLGNRGYKLISIAHSSSGYLIYGKLSKNTYETKILSSSDNILFDKAIRMKLLVRTSLNSLTT